MGQNNKGRQAAAPWFVAIAFCHDSLPRPDRSGQRAVIGPTLTGQTLIGQALAGDWRVAGTP